ncbi:hypothetical protein J8655_01015 [Dickeya oryzae]|uniref:hypothetical protein n=1 Tax=Dickeya oryzae TaxID=1240404 RepID=UPI001AECDE79|nr:hypothetical protein [Dickeya oryzae]MBP2844086.1 hypothetical protein [Dickeya oryzae]
MSELMMKMFGLFSYVRNGQEMAERLKRSGVNNISVVGRGAIVVHGQNQNNAAKMNALRQQAKRIVENDTKEIAAQNKESDAV